MASALHTTLQPPAPLECQDPNKVCPLLLSSKLTTTTTHNNLVGSPWSDLGYGIQGMKEEEVLAWGRSRVHLAYAPEG